jgi:hypothetical protein
MALKLQFAALSLGASVDQQTGTLSVFDVLDEIKAPQLPIHLQTLVISIILEKTHASLAEGKLFIHILTPDGKQAMVGSGEMRIPAEQKRMKAVFRLGGFPVQQMGAHRFVVSWLNPAGTKEGEALLDFEVSQAPQIAQGVETPHPDDTKH